MKYKRCDHYSYEGDCPCLDCEDLARGTCEGCMGCEGYAVDTDKLCPKAKAYCENGRTPDDEWREDA